MARKDARIDAYLAKFGRYGIPLNVAYGSKAPQGIALPELLSADSVLKALDSAGDPTGKSAEKPTEKPTDQSADSQP